MASTEIKHVEYVYGMLVLSQIASRESTRLCVILFNRCIRCDESVISLAGTCICATPLVQVRRGPGSRGMCKGEGPSRCIRCDESVISLAGS